MTFIINPLGQVNTAYAWNFNLRHEAVDAAKKLSSENNVDVQVAEVIGTFRRVTEWSSEVEVPTESEKSHGL